MNSSIVSLFINNYINILSIGHLFDKNGNNNTLWSRSVERKYAKKADCFVKQVSCLKVVIV